MRRAPKQEGFALLLVFAMAAAVAIMLYTEMPRVAFEAQRTREQMLIDRGEQYQRAIQLYVRKMQRYPGRIEDLESTNNVRFLRRRYKDPMTGKDDWRLVHVGPGGVLLDSKVQKLPSPTGDKDKEKKSENTFITEAPQVGSTTIAGVPGADAQSPATVRRASDRAPVQAGAFAAMGGGGGMIGGVVAVDPNAPQPVSPAYPGVQPGQYPGVQPGQYPGMQPGQYPGMQPGQYPGMQPGQPMAGQPGQIVPFPQPGGQVPVPFQAYAQQPPGATPGAATPNPALDLIRNLLTSPRQGGPLGAAAQSTGTQLGGGIAGVASKYEAEGIKVYNEKTAYDEWEFIYDPKNDRALGGGVGTGMMGGAQGLPGQGGAGMQPGSFGQGQGSGGFGTQPATQSPGFGFPPMGQPGASPSPGRGR
jgi:type II secretory pathway pseudopilin PulG